MAESSKDDELFDPPFRVRTCGGYSHIKSITGVVNVILIKP